MATTDEKENFLSLHNMPSLRLQVNMNCCIGLTNWFLGSVYCGHLAFIYRVFKLDLSETKH